GVLPIKHRDDLAGHFLSARWSSPVSLGNSRRKRAISASFSRHHAVLLPNICRGSTRCPAIALPSGDSRTSFTIGAFFRLPTGEPRIQSETAYPAVSTVNRDICPCGFEKLRLFPTRTALLLSATWLSEALSRNCICPFCRGRSCRVA